MIIKNDLAKFVKHEVRVGNVQIGGGNPVVIQSMTDTPTSDVKKTIAQVMELSKAGAEVVRLTVDNLDSARAIPYIKEGLLQRQVNVPLVGCFHYNGHDLLSDVKESAIALDKYRINPGNIGFKSKRDKNFEKIIDIALRHDKPIRIGVNAGSLDQSLLAKLMDENSNLSNPNSSEYVMREAVVKSAIESAEFATLMGMPNSKIILSAKLSSVSDLIYVYRKLHKLSKHPLHLGLTEAGIGMKGVVATSAALSILLQEGIGDTIRASLTPKQGEARSNEIELCKNVLQALGLRKFAPQITSCPGCGRTSADYFKNLTEEVQRYINQRVAEWRVKNKNVDDLKIAVMGCIVNGPGESKQADIGISLPGNGEDKSAVVYVKGQKYATLKGEDIKEQFIKILDDQIMAIGGGE